MSVEVRRVTVGVTERQEQALEIWDGEYFERKTEVWKVRFFSVGAGAVVVVVVVVVDVLVKNFRTYCLIPKSSGETYTPGVVVVRTLLEVPMDR